MQISGINKFTMIEFPGKISCVIFTPGCNFRCAFCHNPEFVLPEAIKEKIKSLISEKAFFSFLEKRKGLLDGVSICGGEPTLQKDLVNFCKKVKEIGYSVKLDTNGRDPKVLKELLEKKLVDYIAMDIKNPIGKFSEIAGVEVDEKLYLESIEVIKNSNIDYEFRTTVINGIHTKEDIENIAKHITGAKKYYIQNYRSGKTLEKKFKGEKFFKKELIKFQTLASEYVKEVEIRD